MLLGQAGDGLNANDDKLDVLCDIFSVSKEALLKTGGIDNNVV
jgi:hypothetical protein